MRVSEESVRQCCLAMAVGVQAEQGMAPAPSARFRQAAGVVEFHTDALKVNTIEDRWRDLKAVLILKRPLGEPGSVEHWEDRRLPVPTARCGFARVEIIAEFQARWRPWVASLGISESAQVEVHGDGADWIWNAGAAEFPGGRQVLDPFHGYGHLSDALKAIHGAETPAFTAAFAAGRQALLAEGWPGLLRFYGEQLPLAGNADALAALEKMLKYFASHAGRLDYPTRLREGRSLGSGPIEGFCKTLGLRLKSRGARWRLANANKMAALVSYFETTGPTGAYALGV